MVLPTRDVDQRLFEVPWSVAVPLGRTLDSAQVRTCLIDALKAAMLKVGGLIGLAAAEDWNEGNVLEASGVLDKMIPIRRRTGIRAKEALDPILRVSSRAFNRWICDERYCSVKL